MQSLNADVHYLNTPGHVTGELEKTFDQAAEQKILPSKTSTCGVGYVQNCSDHQVN